MTKLEKLSIINSLIFVIVTIIWSTTSSPFNVILIIIYYITILLSVIFIVFHIISLIKKRFIAILLIFIAFIPTLDSWSDFHEKVLDFFKPEKELVAYQNWGSCTRSITLRCNSRFEYKEQSPYGAEIYKGIFSRNNDTIVLCFHNGRPKFIKNDLIQGIIKDKKLLLEMSDERIDDYLIYYRK